MKNIKLIIEYDGTNYYGWQKQNDKVTIQGTLEEAVRNLTKEENEVIGCSRTDSGVHARGFVASFKTESTVPPHKFREAINYRLPDDIVVLSSEEVSEDFHPRYLAKGKTYEYTIYNNLVPTALNRTFSYHYKYPLDIEAMKDACQFFKGTHDFKAFRSEGSSVKTTVRTIYDLNIKIEGDFIKISVSGDGFLYNMVRIIVGTLINVGRGKTDATSILEIINKKDRSLAGDCVPPYGLFLKEVYY